MIPLLAKPLLASVKEKNAIQNKLFLGGNFVICPMRICLSDNVLLHHLA